MTIVVGIFSHPGAFLAEYSIGQRGLVCTTKRARFVGRKGGFRSKVCLSGNAGMPNFTTSWIGLSPFSLELINGILDAIIAEVFEVTFYGEHNGPSS